MVSNVYFTSMFLLYFIDGPPIIQSFRSEVARVGDKLALKCEIRQSAEINYFVNGKPIADPQFKSRYSGSCEELTVYEVEYPDDNSIFTCKAHNKYGVDVMNATLRVFGECIISITIALLAF